MSTAYWVTSAQNCIAVIADDNSVNLVMLPVAGDPSSIGNHLPAELRAVCQAPRAAAEYEAWVAALPAPAPPTAAEKLASLGLAADDLKALLA
jgi:hypothetical protein